MNRALARPDAASKLRPPRVVNALAWVLFLGGSYVMFLTDHSYLLGFTVALAGVVLPLPLLLRSRRRSGDGKE